MLASLVCALIIINCLIRNRRPFGALRELKLLLDYIAINSNMCQFTRQKA
jgi:hypothetical protein